MLLPQEVIWTELLSKFISEDQHIHPENLSLHHKNNFEEVEKAVNLILMVFIGLNRG
jgi:hypothetical protein